MRDNKHIDEKFTSQSWANMRALLDENMPVSEPAGAEKKRKRFLFFWLFFGGAILLSGLGYTIFSQNQTPPTPPVTQKADFVADVSTTQTAEISEEKLNEKSEKKSDAVDNTLTVEKTTEVFQQNKNTKAESGKNQSAAAGRVNTTNVTERPKNNSLTGAAQNERLSDFFPQTEQVDAPAVEIPQIEESPVLPAVLPQQTAPVALLEPDAVKFLENKAFTFEQEPKIKVRGSQVAWYAAAELRTDFAEYPGGFAVGLEGVKMLKGNKIGLRGGLAYALKSTPYFVSENTVSESFANSEATDTTEDFPDTIFSDVTADYRSQKYHSAEILGAIDVKASKKWSFSGGAIAGVLLASDLADFGVLQNDIRSEDVEIEAGSTFQLSYADQFTPRRFDALAFVGVQFQATPRLQIFSRYRQGLLDVYPQTEGREVSRGVGAGVRWRL